MSRWFRFYADAMRNPKVGRLSDYQFRVWVELLAVASENDGKIPPMDDLRFLLKRPLNHLRLAVDMLLSLNLLDADNGSYAPHNWSKFQYKSDTSNERVAKYRAKRNVTVTPPDTEAETDSSVAKATGASADSDRAFWANAKAYVGGSNPGALIGKWNRDYGKPETARAITAAQLERAVDPVSFITAALRTAKQPEGVGI